MKILISGSTGFIGSNIARKLLDGNHIVFATHRNTSSFEKCIQFKNKINWINTDSCNWKEQIKAIQPDQLIHVAWSGIDSENRNNWKIQIPNFWLSKDFFDLAKECSIKKVIGIGSQAEYGRYDFPVNEQTLLCPSDAYGAVKTLSANYLRNLFDNSMTEWYWVRVFSVFGESENEGWLIPDVISKLLKEEPISLTFCQQQYNYLYIDDIIDQIQLIVRCSENKSGIYNLCNSESISLKKLLIKITKLMGVSESLLQFGAIPYRTNQNMLIAGDNSKFKRCFAGDNDLQFSMTNGLKRTIEYYKKKEV
jgi:nucleoside-diphosphate-sugar epimerase